MKIDSSSRIILGTDKEGRKIIVENYEMVPEESDLIEDYIRHAQSEDSIDYYRLRVNGAIDNYGRSESR